MYVFFLFDYVSMARLRQYLKAAQLLACSCFLICVCIVIPSHAQITLTQPSAGDRIISQGQYTIQWTGTSPNDTVRIEFSRDNGKSWQLITATATGNQFVWNPVPVINSDNCLIRIASRTVDATPFTISNSFAINYGSNKSERTARSRFASFSPDGTKILAFANNFNDSPGSDTNQIYQVQVWDAMTGKLLYILSSYTVNARTFPVTRWQWNDNSAPWLRYWWSPDSRRIISPVVNDTTFGVYNAQTTIGQPVLTVNVPRLGQQRALRQLRWSQDGREILANVLYRATNSDSILTTLIRFDPFTGQTLGSVSLPLRETTPLEIVSFAGFSNDAKRWMTSHQDRTSGDITRLTVYNASTGTPLSSLRPPSGYRWRQYNASPYQGLWSPDDSLIAFVAEPVASNTNLGAIPETVILKTWTGEIFRRYPAQPTPEPITWSANSRLLLLFNGTDNNTRDVYDVQRGRIDINFRFSTLETTQFPGSGAFNFNPYNVAWSNSMKRIAGYIRPFDPQSPTLGIWDAEIGCLLQTVKLPLIQTNTDVAMPLKWTGFVSWSNDDSRLLLQNFFSDTTLVIPVSTSIPSCKQGGADSTFIIQPRNDFVVQEISSFPAIVCQTIATLNIPIRNISPVSQFARISLENVGNNILPVQDFRLLSAPQQSLRAGESANVSVQFTPTFAGRKTANLVFNLGPSTAPIRTLLVAVKDTIDILPTAPRVDFGLVPANTSTTTSITLRNTGTSTIVWNTNATFSTSGQFWLESVTPISTLPGQLCTAVVRFLGAPTPRIINDSLSLFRCLDRTFTLRVQVNILPDIPKLQFSDSLLFPSIICQTSTEAVITLRNVGGKLLLIFMPNIFGGDDFRIVGTRFPISLAPLDSAQVRVLFQSRRDGITTATLVLNSNDGERITGLVRLRAEKRTLQYALLDSVLEFNDVAEGAERLQTTLFTNRTNAPVSWNRLPIALTPDIVLERANPSQTAAAGGVSELTFRFLGRKDRVEFATNGTLTLNDICQTPFPVQFRVRVGEPRPRLVVASGLGFDSLGCSSISSTATLLIRNVGGRALRIDSLVFSNPNENSFRVLNAALPLVVQPQGSTGSEFALRIQFAPRTLGRKENLLRIFSNDSTTTVNGVQNTLLVGMRDSIGFTVNRQAINFFTTTEQSPLLDSVQITNTGTLPLTWGAFPRRINEQFSIERVEPSTTLVGASSRLILRFAGGAFGVSSPQNLILSPLQCSERSQTLTLRGAVGRQAILDIPTAITQRFVCEGAQTVRIPLQNIGTETLTVTMPQILNDANGAFRLVRSPASIAARGLDTIVLSLQSRAVGVYTALLRIPSSAVNTPVADVLLTVRKDSSGVQAIPSQVDLGNLAEGTSTTQTIRFENTGNIPQTLILHRQIGVFAVNWEGVAAGTSSVVLLPNARLQATITFPASTSGTYSETLSLQDSCGSLVRVPITARVIAGQILLPALVQLAQSQEQVVSVRVISRSGINAGVLASFRLRIANASVLEVRSPQALRSRVENGARILHFAEQIPAGTDTVPLLQLGLRGLLGNDTRTTITIDSAFIGSVAVRGSVSQFQTLGVNSSGGTRLYYTPPVQLVALAPNPAQDVVSLHLKAIEAAQIQVFIVDVLGKRTQMVNTFLQQGDHTVVCALTSLSSGVYSIEIFANGTRQTAQIHVVK
jgi:hypothetical protein